MGEKLLAALLRFYQSMFCFVLCNHKVNDMGFFFCCLLSDPPATLPYHTVTHLQKKREPNETIRNHHFHSPHPSLLCIPFLLSSLPNHNISLASSTTIPTHSLTHSLPPYLLRPPTPTRRIRNLHILKLILRDSSNRIHI